MNAHTVDILTVSATLARRWSDFTPQMELAWNPRDEKQTVTAVTKWLDHVSENMFAVADYCPNLSDAREFLERVPLMPQGHDLLFSDYYHDTSDLESLFYLLLVVGYYVETDEIHQSGSFLEELRDVWGFDRLAPLYKIGDWFEDKLYRATHGVGSLVEALAYEEGAGDGAGEETDDEAFAGSANFWRGMLHMTRYYEQNTPHDILNYANNMDEGYDDFWRNHSCDWSDVTAVGKLVDAWRESDAYMAHSQRVYTWAENSQENLQYVAQCLRDACRAVLETGWHDEGFRKTNQLLQFAGTAVWEDALSGDYPYWEEHDDDDYWEEEE